MNGWVKRLPILLLLLLLRAAAANAEQNTFTDAQWLYGTGFRDRYADPNTFDGRLSTIALEHFGEWNYGDNYLLVNFYQGAFIKDNGEPERGNSKIFGKWVSRLSVGKLAGNAEGLRFLCFKDFFFGGRIDRAGQGYYANDVGPGIDFALSKQLIISINAYLRKDAFNAFTWQLSPFWDFRFSVHTLRLQFTGYLDLAGSDSAGMELNTQSHLLLELGMGALKVGFSLTASHNDAVSVIAPQGELRWAW